MKYVGALFLIIIVFRTLTFARFNWLQRNKRAAVGSAALAVCTLAGPLILMALGRL